MKKLEYIWLDGYQPEPLMRSKVKVIDGEIPGNHGSDPQIGLLMVHRHSRLRVETQTVS